MVYRRFATYGFCAQCGQRLLAGHNNARHRRSLYHRCAPQIRKLMESGATLEEVGNQLGVTRERIRQLAKRMGIPNGTKVRKAKKETQRFSDFLNKLPHTRLGRFLEAAAKHGLTSELVATKSETISPWFRNRAVVSGKHVLVKPAYDFYNAFGTHYIRIISTNLRDVDLIAYELPDGRWAFFKPFGAFLEYNGERGSNSTLFALHEVLPGDKGYTYDRGHNHRAAIENWALLEN